MFRILLFIILSLSRITCGSSCTEWEFMDDNVTYSFQKQCEYSRIEETDITIRGNASKQSQMFNITIKSVAKCYDPQLVIDFDTISLHNNTYYSFYIWQKNIDKNETSLPIIENYTNIYGNQCLNLSKRIWKTSPTENKWAVIDHEYQDLIESQILNAKTTEIKVTIFVSPQISSSVCTQMSHTALNAKITLKCSTALDWEFDFEDQQTLWTFSVCLIIFCFLWSFSICRIRYIQLKQQYMLSQNMDKGNIPYRDLCSFGCCCNEEERCYLFISHDDDEAYYPLANTWFWYVLFALMLPLYSVLLALFQTDFNFCHWWSIIMFMNAPWAAIFLIDLNCCTARWFCREKCIKLKEYIINNKQICDEHTMKRMRRKCPSLLYIYALICALITLLNIVFLSTCEEHMFVYSHYDYIVGASFALISLLSVSWIPFIGFFLFIAIFNGVIEIHTNYQENWSIILTGMPGLLMFLFASPHDKLRELAPTFLGFAVSLYDVFTDINLIILWWESSKIFWALFQILFILMGQLVGAIDEYGCCGSNALKTPRRRRSCQDKCCCLLTVIGGRMKYGFTINSESIEDTNDNEIDDEAILQTLKINEMVWESVYSVALQIYIATLFDHFNGTLIFSLATSFANVTDSLYHFVENNKNKKTMTNKQWVTWIIWLYIVTDFLHRIIPNIALSVLFDKYYGEHHEEGNYVFYIVASLLFIMNVALECVVLKWRHCRHIILSLVSSSYLLLGALRTTGVVNIDNNGFEIVQKERLWRTGLSLVLTAVCLLSQVAILFVPTLEKDRIFYPQILGLIITEIIVIILHFQMASMFDNDIITQSEDNVDNNNNHVINTRNSDKTQIVELVANTQNETFASDDDP